VATYRIHPGIGIARLGNSDSEFYLAPETPGGLPQECDRDGNARYGADGTTPLLVRKFKDAEGRIKRQAARFQVFVYDEAAPAGRPLRLGDAIAGGGNHGTLVDIQWRVYLANKKAAWYQFDATAGEHGYADGHRRRNAQITGRARDRLIIDPGPRIVNATDKRRAAFDRSGDGGYATSFPPAGLQPFSIDTLGEIMTDASGRLLVLGGHGRSGSERGGPGEPHIDTYANSDGWYDDTSDGPVMARLVMYSHEVAAVRYIDVEYPAWAIVGYPRYVPEILDVVTMDDVLYDLFVRAFAYDTALYGREGSFDAPDRIDVHDEAALRQWRAGRLVWNRAVKPWFYRDVWTILFRPDEFRFLSDVLAKSNFPHDQEKRGLFNPRLLGKPPHVTTARRAAALRKAEAAERPLSAEMASEPGPTGKRVHLDAGGRWIEDEFGPQRRYLYGLLRLPGEENEFKIEDRVSGRLGWLHNLPLMPLLCGDNPLTNTAPSKFMRLTDTQLFTLRQWAEGCFLNEAHEGWLKMPPYSPFRPYPADPPRSGRELDRGVLANVLGGAFCPGGEVGWIMRNPSIYREPYRIKADRGRADFLEPAAQANRTGSALTEESFYLQDPLAQDNDFVAGLQPGDLTKYMALPWQADFNECTTNPVNITYPDWNSIAPESDNDQRLAADEKAWVTLWWPAHRPLQTFELSTDEDGSPAFPWTYWSRGIPQTKAGDLKMVTEWSKLGFVIRNPYLPDDAFTQASDGSPKYISVERS